MARKNKYVKAFKKLLRDNGCKRDFYRCINLFMVNDFHGYVEGVTCVDISNRGKNRPFAYSITREPLMRYSRFNIVFWDGLFDKWLYIYTEIEKSEKEVCDVC